MKYKLPEGWEEVRLAEVANYLNDKVAIDKCEIDKYISTTNMIENKGGIIVSDSLPKAKSVNSFKKGDILISNIRPYFKKIWFATFDGTSSTDVLILRGNKNIYNKYLYYVLSNDYFFDYTTKSAKGTKMPRGDKNAIMDYLVPKLSFKEQKAIADTLSSLDDKTELNNKINENLEQQAQAIFKHWFIDFEFPDENGNPYKSSGGEMVESELGMIPKGWEVLKLEDLVTHIESGNWGKEKEEGNYTEKSLCIRGTDIPEVKRGGKGDMPTRYIIPRHVENKALKKGDIVVEMSGGSPTQSTGRSLYINQELLDNYSVPILCTNFCKIFKVKEKYEKMFYYNWEYLYSMGHMFSYENGTTGIKNLDEKSLLQNNLIANPTKEILLKFNEYIAVINKNKAIIGNQNQTLSQLRDTLLPKLMSGEIRIPLD